VHTFITLRYSRGVYSIKAATTATISLWLFGLILITAFTAAQKDPQSIFTPQPVRPVALSSY
jgi:hypothetical protein